MTYLIAYLTGAFLLVFYMSRKESLRQQFRDGAKEIGHVASAAIIVGMGLIWPAIIAIGITMVIFGVKRDELEVGKFKDD